MSILVVILIISFLVIIHEIGHFVMAKRKKVNVEEFGLGYPPRLLKLFTWKETLFSLNAIPFGGFVKLEGEDGPNNEVKKKKTASKLKPFYKVSAADRSKIILTGPVVNFLFGVVAFAVVFSFLGIPTQYEQPRIEEVMANTPASEAGIPANVNILGFGFDDESVDTSSIEEVQEFVSAHLGETVSIKTTSVCDIGTESCKGALQSFEVYLRTAEETPADQGSMGIIFADTYFKFYPWYEMPFRGVAFGLEEALMLGWMILEALGGIFKDLFTGNGLAEEIAGPIGIVHQAHEHNLAGAGALAILSFSGMLSINLAVMNLLPLPALDGGRALFILLEKFIGKNKIEKIEGAMNYGGFALLMALIILVTIRDVWRLFV